MYSSVSSVLSRYLLRYTTYLSDWSLLQIYSNNASYSTFSALISIMSQK